jgi:predicted lactoylglutathione lyase
MKQLFINLPVKNLDASMHFYTQLGFTVNPLFTFDNQKCMVWSDHVYLMLQSYEMFQSGNTKPLADPKKNTIATFTLPVESIDQLNAMMEKAIQAGGTEPTPLLDEGFMQVRNIEDLDGHQWGIICLDMDKFKALTGKE